MIIILLQTGQPIKNLGKPFEIYLDEKQFLNIELYFSQENLSKPGLKLSKSTF